MLIIQLLVLFCKCHVLLLSFVSLEFKKNRIAFWATNHSFRFTSHTPQTFNRVGRTSLSIRHENYFSLKWKIPFTFRSLQFVVIELEILKILISIRIPIRWVQSVQFKPVGYICVWNEIGFVLNLFGWF